MFESFKKKERQMPEWLIDLEETQNRWFVFLEKLEAKMSELCDAAIPELEEINRNDDDIYKRKYQQVLSGICGQLNNIRQKAGDTYEDKIIGLFDSLNCEVPSTSPDSEILYKFRNDCCDRYNIIFDEKYQDWLNKLHSTDGEDLEKKYESILLEFQQIKDKFICQQCSGNLVIEKVFFITAYVNCPYCQTQNTFEPSTLARSLENFARKLAEQRTVNLLNEYHAEIKKERELYHRNHELHLSTIHEKDKKILSEKRKLEQDLENQRQESIKNARVLYEIYLRAMFDEWNKIVPDFKEHNERFYQTMLEEFRAGN